MRPPTAVLRLRKATLDDGPFLLTIRNLEDVRVQSKSRDVIAEQTHIKWLLGQISNPDCLIWIVEEAGSKQGYIRAQKIIEGKCSSGAWLLSIALNSSGRGHGVGKWAVEEVCRLMKQVPGATSLIAEVLGSNQVARRLFNRAGFQMLGEGTNSQSIVRLGLHLA